MAHDFRDDNSMMAVRGAVQAVNGFSGNVHRGGKTKRRVGHGHVIVNRLGQRDDIETGFVQAQGIFLRAAAAETHDAVESPFLVIGDDCLGHVAGAAVNDHAVRLVAAGAKNRAADGENSRERGAVEFHSAVFHEAAKAVAKADEFHAVVGQAGFADATDGGVEAGAVAASGEDSGAFDFFAHAVNDLKPPIFFCRAKV